MDDRLQLDMTDDGDPVVLTVTGELDLTTTDALHDSVAAHLTAGRSVVLDLSGLSFVDSTGLSTLVKLNQAAGDAGSAFQLRAVPDHAMRLMTITKIDTVLAFAD